MTIVSMMALKMRRVKSCRVSEVRTLHPVLVGIAYLQLITVLCIPSKRGGRVKRSKPSVLGELCRLDNNDLLMLASSISTPFALNFG